VPLPSRFPRFALRFQRLVIYVVKIDDREASMVTLEYVTTRRYVVYTMTLGSLWRSFENSVR